MKLDLSGGAGRYQYDPKHDFDACRKRQCADCKGFMRSEARKLVESAFGRLPQDGSFIDGNGVRWTPS